MAYHGESISIGTMNFTNIAELKQYTEPISLTRETMNMPMWSMQEVRRIICAGLSVMGTEKFIYMFRLCTGRSFIKIPMTYCLI